MHDRHQERLRAAPLRVQAIDLLPDHRERSLYDILGRRAVAQQLIREAECSSCAGVIQLREGGLVASLQARDKRVSALTDHSRGRRRRIRCGTHAYILPDATDKG